MKGPNWTWNIILTEQKQRLWQICWVGGTKERCFRLLRKADEALASGTTKNLSRCSHLDWLPETFNQQRKRNMSAAPESKGNFYEKYEQFGRSQNWKRGLKSRAGDSSLNQEFLRDINKEDMISCSDLSASCAKGKNAMDDWKMLWKKPEAAGDLDHWEIRQRRKRLRPISDIIAYDHGLIQEAAMMGVEALKGLAPDYQFDEATADHAEFTQLNTAQKRPFWDEVAQQAYTGFIYTIQAIPAWSYGSSASGKIAPQSRMSAWIDIAAGAWRAIVLPIGAWSSGQRDGKHWCCWSAGRCLNWAGSARNFNTVRKPHQHNNGAALDYSDA